MKSVHDKVMPRSNARVLMTDAINNEVYNRVFCGIWTGDSDNLVIVIKNEWMVE